MSKYVQTSFNGGMNLLDDDSRLQPNQYRLGLNVRNRFGKFNPINNGVEDTRAPIGLKQEIKTFGEYIILFCAGYCYYRHYTSVQWIRVLGFQMSTTAPRYWTEVVPILSNKYLRKLDTGIDASSPVSINVVSGASAGNIPGLVVQDNINQPYFVYLNPNTGLPTARVLQTYAQWDWTEASTDVLETDNREYVPIGNSMAWVDGILYVTSQDFNRIYRSVEGRPIDFVVNIKADGTKGGDAETSAYSVGVGGISCIRAMSTGALFVAAGNANFSVSKNMTPNAPTLWGQYTFIRTFLFNSTCLSDRAILDSLGDTKFVDTTGIRSFNAILQSQNEGRNSLFSMMIQSIFNGITHSVTSSAAILYDNYEHYAVNTVLGPAIAIYDTLNQDWVSFDLYQSGQSLVKMLAKIELSVQRLYAITEDDRLYTMYSGTEYAPVVRTLSVSSKTLTIDDKRVPSEWEHKLQNLRASFSNITKNFTATCTPFVQNRLAKCGSIVKNIQYQSPTETYNGIAALDDVDTGVNNAIFPTLNCNQGSQTYCLISWTSQAELMGFSVEVTDIKPVNSLRSQR